MYFCFDFMKYWNDNMLEICPPWAVKLKACRKPYCGALSLIHLHSISCIQ